MNKLYALMICGFLLMSVRGLAAEATTNTVNQVACVLSNAPSVADSKVKIYVQFNQSFDPIGSDRILPSQHLLANIGISLRGTGKYKVLRRNVLCTRDFPFYASRLVCTWGPHSGSSIQFIPNVKDSHFSGRYDGDLVDLALGEAGLDTRDLTYSAGNSLVCTAKNLPLPIL